MSTSTTPKQSALDLIDSRPLTRNQKNLVALAVVGNISEFFDIFLIGFVVSVLTKPWNLTGTEAGVILACSGLGTVVGSIMWGRLADKIGRRSSFFWCVLLFVVFTVVSVFTPDRGWIMLAILRIGVGIGVGGLNITSIPYVQEFVPAKQRGLLAGLASVFIPLGLFLGSLAQNALGDNWRALIALGAIPVFLLVWIRFVPESPRFLQSHGRDKEAREALAWALDMPADDIEICLPLNTSKTLPTHLSLVNIARVFSSSVWDHSASFWALSRFSRGARPCSRPALASLPSKSGPCSCSSPWPISSDASYQHGWQTALVGGPPCCRLASSVLAGLSSSPFRPAWVGAGRSSSSVSSLRWPSPTAPSASSMPSAPSNSQRSSLDWSGTGLRHRCHRQDHRSGAYGTHGGRICRQAECHPGRGIPGIRPVRCAANHWRYDIHVCPRNSWHLARQDLTN